MPSPRTWSVRATGCTIGALLLLPALLAAQQPETGPTGTVTGRVTDAASSRPVVGAQVFVPATRQGAAVGDNGTFTIARVPAGPTTLRVQMLGYEPATQQVVVTAGAPVTVTFTMRRSAVALSEVVVTATGQEQRRAIGNAIATVDSAEVRRSSVVNTQQLIAGRAAGVTVLANSGQPGTGGSIRLRGVNSVSQGNNPLIYVDGVRLYNGSTPTSVSGRQNVLPLNDINAADIDHVEIVKGPAATTLYGTEASGGVIQIFTKRGHNATPSWSLDVSEGFNNMGHVGPESDATGLFFNECRGPNLVNGIGTKFEDPTCPASGTWLRNGAVGRYAASVRGGTNDLGYFVSGNVNQEKGVLPSSANRDGGFRGNFNFRPTKKTDFSLNSSYQRRNVELYADGNSSNGALLNISRGPNTNFKAAGCADATMVCASNANLFDASNTIKSDHFISGFTVNYTPAQRFENRLAVGFDYNQADIQTITPFGYLRVPLGQIFLTNWRRSLITTDYAGTLRASLGGSFASTTSWGGQMFDSRRMATYLQSDNFSGPGQPVITSGSLRSITDADNQRVINAGFFAQQMIAWRDRLFVTVGARADGNSAFGKSFGLQVYPKLSASYVLSDESFWPTRWVETLKLRAAVGDAGKAPGAFDAVRTWSPVAAENGQPAFTPAQLGNPDLGPERTREVEGGFDLSAAQGLLGLNVTAYRQRTFDALVPVTLPPSQGFSTRQLMNVGELKNDGLEITATLGLVRTSAVDLQGRLNFTTIKSEAGDLGGQTLTIDALSRTYVKQGYPVPSYFGRTVTNPDAFADPVIAEDQYIGGAFPTKIIAPAATLTLWNRLTLDALGEWQLGGHLLNAVAYQNANLNVWQPCYDTQAKLRRAATGDAGALSDVTAMERAKCTLNGALRDYAFWVDESDFFRLRSVSATWDVPARFVPGARSAALTLAGRNLFTSTKYNGTDPEVADQRDNTFSRRDYYVFPSYRTFLATVRIGF